MEAGFVPFYPRGNARSRHLSCPTSTLATEGSSHRQHLQPATASGHDPEAVVRFSVHALSISFVCSVVNRRGRTRYDPPASSSEKNWSAEGILGCRSINLITRHIIHNQ